MKSRKFTFTRSTETNESAAQGLLLTRAPGAATPDVAACGVVRRFELEHNQSPRFARRRQERRQGQALLLAVLIMLLAALLSAGFLAVVSGNLNQSARVADKTRAIEASRAGIAYANAQLSGSANGDLWRPVDVNPVPTNPVDFNNYYSQLEKIQGWAVDPTTNGPDKLYAKFPAAGQAIGDAPKFLVNVEELPLTLPTTDPDYEHRGEVKITSIGLSDDDPNVFHRAVAYKTGRRKSPWASAFRSVSNWDFKNKTVPKATLSQPSVVPAPNGYRTLQVTVNANAQQGQFPAVPFNAILIHKDATTPANSRTTSAVVTAVDTSNAAAPVYTLSGTIPFAGSTYEVGDTLQVAASLGTPTYIDLLNTGTTPPSGLVNVPLQDQPNGLLVNGSINLRGRLQMLDLRQSGTKIQSSGAIYPSSAIPVSVGGDVSTAGTLLPSSNTSFPGNFTPASGVAKTDLVNDAWNKIEGAKPLGLDYSGGATRSVTPFEPADISSPNNLARYRALTRNSDTDSNGYRAGVYIDNRDDIEKVYNATRYEPMTQKQLIDMLVSPKSTTPADFARNGLAATVANTSLEQKHLRGWVGPDEFLPRGALVEITTDSYPSLGITAPSLRVTLDARSDAIPNGPDPDKTWRNANGAPDAGVYTRVLPWPANGTIFAEGNIRVRGEVPSTILAPRSLTIVSQNNIYIEGALSAGITRKLLLLAKKNVIVNPTRAIMARTDLETTAKNVIPISVGAMSSSFNLPVASSYAFNVGDYVTVEGQVGINDTTAKTIRGIVTANNNNQLTINSPDKGFIRAIDPPTILVGAVVRSPLEKREGATATPNATTYSVVDTENTINRRILVPASSLALNKLLFDHVGDLKQVGTAPSTQTAGLKIKAVNQSSAAPLPTSGFTAELTNKQQLLSMTEDRDPTARNLAQTNKMARVYNNFTPGNKDVFTDPPTQKTLTQFAAEISAFVGQNKLPATAEGYKYTATVEENPPPALTSGTGELPYYALAGVGLRYDPGATPLIASDNARQQFTTQTGDTAPEVSYTIPLATSIEFDLNATIRNLTNGSLNTSTYFGFSPTLAGTDDALTVDRYFYQLKADARKSTLDQRDLVLPTAPTIKMSSLVFKRPDTFAIATTPGLSPASLPDYRVRGLKLENINGTTRRIRPVMDSMNINAFVYAQEGSWFVIPGDYFRTDPAVRGDVDSSGNFTGSYIDYGNTDPNNPQPDAGEYILDGLGRKVADLNRNGVNDANNGEREAALRFVRYNHFQIKFTGAIVENQTAIVTDVPNASNNGTLETGAVAQWMDKWAAYDDTAGGATQGDANNFKFITYTYDPVLRTGSDPFLRVPVTDDLLYQQ